MPPSDASQEGGSVGVRRSGVGNREGSGDGDVEDGFFSGCCACCRWWSRRGFSGQGVGRVSVEEGEGGVSGQAVPVGLVEGGVFGQVVEGGASGQEVEVASVEEEEGALVRWWRREREGASGQAVEGESVEEGEGGVSSREGGGRSCEEGEGGSGSRELGMREQIRQHFRMVRSVLAGEYAVREGGRVVHWDGPSVRPRIFSGNGGRQVGEQGVAGQEALVGVGSQEGLAEAIVHLKALPDDFAVYGQFAMARVGGEQLFGPFESMQLAFWGGRL